MGRIATLDDGDNSQITADSEKKYIVIGAKNKWQKNDVSLLFFDVDGLRSLKTFCQAVAAKCDELLNNQPLDK